MHNRTDDATTPNTDHAPGSDAFELGSENRGNAPTLISDAEKDVRLNAQTAPRVTVESINAKIAASSHIVQGTMTICTITMKNGFQVVGTSACVDPANFDPQIGIRIAYDNAFRQLWPLEGYLLAESRI